MINIDFLVLGRYTNVPSFLRILPFTIGRFPATPPTSISLRQDTFLSSACYITHTNTTLSFYNPHTSPP